MLGFKWILFIAEPRSVLRLHFLLYYAASRSEVSFSLIPLISQNHIILIWTLTFLPSYFILDFLTIFFVFIEEKKNVCLTTMPILSSLLLILLCQFLQNWIPPLIWSDCFSCVMHKCHLELLLTELLGHFHWSLYPLLVLTLF